ncbi:hypothetical protein CUJ83_01320 [Methanocella sp. CWC-04]|uniref:Uncharacterized protein n=1 Tax=Methanooceanicella nereidis TaxID=2052831 RepID=A0AAP2RCN8_9EURY|nr:hypothetical protein [Methanocella sp. CWC-04]MCD1293635.1 hypothetical protein [Methanocella sp. CWC-04]
MLMAFSLCTTHASALTFEKAPFITFGCTGFMAPCAYTDLLVIEFNNDLILHEYNAGTAISFSEIETNSPCNILVMPTIIQGTSENLVGTHSYFYSDVFV